MEHSIFTERVASPYTFRALTVSDEAIVKSLFIECFPLVYPDSLYADLVSELTQNQLIMSLQSMLFNFLILWNIFIVITAQICPLDPECACTGFVGTVATSIACIDQGRIRIPISEINTAVENLDLSGNGIILEPGQLRNLTNLKRLDLSRNSLVYIPAGTFDGLVSLETLTLDGNLFTPDTLVPENFTGAENITSLSLAGNQLSLPITNNFLGFFTKLKTLNLDSNLYQYLSPTFFDIISSTLEELFLSDNLIINLPVSIFTSLTQLFLLDLSGNNLETLPNGIFSSLVSTEIRLADNPWSCDCFLPNLTGLIAAPGTLNFSDADIAFCDVPDNLNTMTLTTVTGLTCFAPSFITQPQDASILTTQDIRLNCSNTGLPIPSVTWYRNGIFIINSFQDDERISVLTDGALYISNATLADDGMYYCVISNTEGSVTSSFAYLTVEEITCFDNITSSHETDRDCGGPYCTPCDVGQKCLLNSDCDNGICLYAHTAPSQLLYITKFDDLAYTCNAIEVGTVVLQMRLASIFFGTPDSSLNTSSGLDTINGLVRQALSSQLEIPVEAILNVNVMTVERYFTPLVQIFFYIENSHYGLIAQNVLIDQINTEKLKVTMKLESLQNSISVRMNF
ncbi:Leucine-rich repeat and fibronectin type-III domain-containing protein 5-like [Oopsacas minuta]|uniref:Leucine-rich repeat and fibronectin type-III domain-containing protein 5-like n=1 Tax=Oopsacas minuta TaxID=111878 RepID=A0AAV7JVF8_9METZ|nr:Leucine-rich repeat and fibronectin type-III domain-containing protein 5-like [Oopsacas minuta]